jgi:hypothetical protein
MLAETAQPAGNQPHLIGNMRRLQSAAITGCKDGTIYAVGPFWIVDDDLEMPVYSLCVTELMTLEVILR